MPPPLIEEALDEATKFSKHLSVLILLDFSAVDTRDEWLLITLSFWNL